MKNIYTVAVIALIAGTTALSTPALAREGDRGGRPEIRRDVNEIRGDRQELRRDKRELRQDIREHREDVRERRDERREDAKDNREERLDEAKNSPRGLHERLENACRGGNENACRKLNARFGDGQPGDDKDARRDDVRGEHRGELRAAPAANVPANDER